MNETNVLKSEFEHKGYIKLPKYFSDEEITELQEEIIKAAGLLEKKSGLNKDNMIFHSNVFLRSQYLQEFVSREKIIRTIQDVMGTDFWVRWDQCVAKAPGGAAFPWHQDNAYNRLHDEHFQFWIGITEMTEENGGLWLQPGSHRLGLLPHEMRENHQVCTELPGEGVL